MQRSHLLAGKPLRPTAGNRLEYPRDAYSREDFKTWVVSSPYTTISCPLIPQSRPGVMQATVIAENSKQLSPKNWTSVFGSQANLSNPIQRISITYSPRTLGSNEPGWAIFVMPFLREYGRPHFDTIGEAVAFSMQIFEYRLHKPEPNDGWSPLCRTPFHPRGQDLKRDFTGNAHPDLTLSVHLIRTEFLEGDKMTSRKLRSDSMWPPVMDMVQTDSKRPGMDEVVRRLDEIVGDLSSWRFRSRVPRDPPS
ncbi:hypothetical protein B0H11DRAFT_2188306 [Mycena galericulata]|nr:hypothetical protein B0H11DRAFT_2188306 [Mycena galericulata]